ncbi:predicted protein [Chaetoceros tenuissimus]|uniref:Uncharacterized protein n=1 Tax=Chaetoceros tenuissimus TaxID=426638 RepID=A0AAD3HAC3_9STRA|nr:predicted protein [Chaetoceros tenuissimus]
MGCGALTARTSLSIINFSGFDFGEIDTTTEVVEGTHPRTELPVLGTCAESTNQNTAAYILVNFKSPSVLSRAVSELEDLHVLIRNKLPNIDKLVEYLGITQAEPGENETEAERAIRMQQNSMMMAPANALFTQEMNQFSKKKSLLQENMAKLWRIILGQCTKALVKNLRAEHDFEK